MLFINTHFCIIKGVQCSMVQKLTLKKRITFLFLYLIKNIIFSGSFNTAMLLSTHLQSTPKVPRISSLIKYPTKPKSRA